MSKIKKVKQMRKNVKGEQKIYTKLRKKLSGQKAERAAGGGGGGG